jgi:hypothetical protein
MRCAFRERSYKITKRTPNNVQCGTPKMNSAENDIPTNGANRAGFPEFSRGSDSEQRKGCEDLDKMIYIRVI